MAITRTAMIDDDGSGTTGTILNNVWKQELYTQIDGLVGPWTPYAVQWTSNAGFPGIGNGILEGRYALHEKTCHLTIYVQFGSTTSVGSGAYYIWSLPFAARSMNGLAGFTIAHNAAGGAGQAPGIAYPLSASTFIGVGTSGVLFSPNTPVAWASGYSISIRGFYEVP